MFRSFLFRIVLAVAVVLPTIALAGAYDDLVKVQAAFQNVKSYHAVEQFSNGHTVILDYAAPDRWRIQPNPNTTELLIGNDAYMVHNGKSMHLPFGGMMTKMIKDVGFSANQDIKDSARDLGTQTLNGESVHVYTYTSRGVPSTLYVGKDLLPVQNVVKDKKVTTTITYSKYNEPVTIQP